MTTASRLGDGWLWWAVGFGILFEGGRHRYQVLVAGGVAAGVAQGVSRLIKVAVARPRPCVDTPHVWAKVPPPDPWSFPSAHTMTSYAFAAAIGSAYPELFWWLQFAAFSVAASRIVLGLRYLSDVLAGATVGWGIGFAAHRFL
jgi:undecaprenyl-diphosphatase